MAGFRYSTARTSKAGRPRSRGMTSATILETPFALKTGFSRSPMTSIPSSAISSATCFPSTSIRTTVSASSIGSSATSAPAGRSGPCKNSGVMIHCQSPETMKKDQEFPVSIEVQFLGGNGKDKRPTGNVCTPGTNIVMKDKLITQHCNDSRSKTYHGDEWVTVEVEVHGNGTSST